MSSRAHPHAVFNLNLAAWLAIRARRPEAIARGFELRFYLAGGMLSAIGALQERLYRRELDQLVLKPPLFLVGHWRSGTTLLHELLALDDRFAAPSTYACFNPHHFLLTRDRALTQNTQTRPTGDIAVSATSPQEEEFALLCMGAKSPYEAFMFPSALHEFEALCDPDLFDHANQLRWDRAITWILKATSCVSGAGKQPLVKSPSNSFRISRLDRLFPGAAFVRIVREPCAVFASTLRLWQTMWERYALAAPLAREVLIERILQTRIALERKLESAIRLLPPERVMTLRYEDLISEPRATIELLYDSLALGDPSPVIPRIREYMARSLLRPTPSAEEWRPLVEARWPQMFEEFGYARS